MVSKGVGPCAAIGVGAGMDMKRGRLRFGFLIPRSRGH